MRTSFIKSTLKHYHQNLQTIKLQDDEKLSHLGENQTQKESNQKKFNKNTDVSMEISFNLDQMYFESDSSTEQTLKNKLSKSKKCFMNKQQVIPIKQELATSPKTNNQSKQITSTQQSTMENVLSSSKAQQCSREQKIKKEALQIECEDLSAPKYKQFKDQQIQVDFSQAQASAGNSVEQLSQIDMLFIFPQNIANYNHDHPLQVKLGDLAKIYPLNLQLRNFVKLDRECHDVNVRKIFQAFMIDWGKSDDRLSKKVLTLAKMRTIIIRDAMNNLVDELVPPVDTEDYHFRIGKTYRNRYIKSGIPIPPPRVNNSYLEGLFSHTQIRKYYLNYVEEKLQIFLKDQNYRKIQIYTLDLIQCLKLHQDKNISQLEEILQRKKKPFTNKQIELIIQEARKIGNQYGKDAKRIGNGVRRSKMLQKSQKILSKFVKQIDSQSNQFLESYDKNQFFEEESDEQIQKMTRKRQKRVKTQHPAPQVKIEVKIEQTPPKQKPNLIIIETPKVKSQQRSFQDKVKTE